MKLSPSQLLVGFLLLPVVSAFVATPRRTALLPPDQRVSSSHQVHRSRIVLYNKPLATEGEWTAYLDEEGTGLIYYFNGKTGESLWEPPTATFPPIELTGRMRKQARVKQEEYVKATKLQEKEAGFLSSFSTNQQVVAEKEPEPAPKEKEGEGWFNFLKEPEPAPKEKEGEDWFSSLFEDKQKQEAKVDLPVVEEEPTRIPVAEEEVSEPKTGFLSTLFAREQAVEEKPVEIITPAVAEPAPIKLDMSAYVLPHPAKMRWGGEDATFTKGRTFGVFDGVSGAEKLDGVPLYSKTLASELKESVGDNGLNIREMTDLLLRARETADKTATGASTAVIASISEDGFLRALNVGDSACIVIRDGKVVGKTKEISHYFECPYQLSVDSPDRPRDGTKFNFELLKGDLIIMGSDGIFDNLSDEKVAELVASGPKKPSGIARRVSQESRKVSLNRQVVTPYSTLARKFGDPDFSDGIGGKVDDISCVVVCCE